MEAGGSCWVLIVGWWGKLVGGELRLVVGGCWVMGGIV